MRPGFLSYLPLWLWKVFEVVGLAQVGPTEKTSGLPAFHPLQLQAPGGVDL